MFASSHNNILLVTTYFYVYPYSYKVVLIHCLCYGTYIIKIYDFQENKFSKSGVYTIQNLEEKLKELSNID